MDIKVYLDRINFEGKMPLKADLSTLQVLQNCHQTSVPFENFDALKGTITNLKVPDLYEKIVTKKMGGWCFHLNGLFQWLLCELGFSVELTGSSIHRFDLGGTWENPNHVVLLVHINKQAYLTDVGVGMYRMPFDPIAIFDGSISEQPNGRFMIHRDGQYWILSYQKLDDNHKWDKVYRFETDRPKTLSDFQTILENYTYGREPLVIGLISKPMAQRKANGGKDGKAYVINSYRHFTDMGSITAKKCIKRCDWLEKGEIEDILRTEFGLVIDMADVDLSKSVDMKYVESLAGEEREDVVNKLIAAPGLSLHHAVKVIPGVCCKCSIL